MLPNAAVFEEVTPPPGTSEDTIVVRQARWKGALLLTVSAIFLPAGVFLALEPGGGLDGSAAVAIPGAGVLLGSVQIVRRARLTLSPAGLKLEHLKSERSWAWDRVRDFRVSKKGRRRLVTFDDMDAKPSLKQRLTSNAATGSATLPSSWAMKPQALAELLEERRRRWA